MLQLGGRARSFAPYRTPRRDLPAERALICLRACAPLRRPSWENHQQSKKHKKVVAQLRRQLEADDVAAASAATGPDDVVADRASAGEDEMPWSDSEMFLDGDLERFSDDSLSGETSDGRPRGEGSGAESSEESGSDVDLSGLVGMRKRGNGARPETDGHINEGRGPAAASSEGPDRAGPVSPAAKSEEESEEESR